MLLQGDLFTSLKYVPIVIRVIPYGGRCNKLHLADIALFLLPRSLYRDTRLGECCLQPSSFQPLNVRLQLEAPFVPITSCSRDCAYLSWIVASCQCSKATCDGPDN